MLLRRATPLALAIAAIACEPSVPYDPAAHNPSAVDYAVFDPAPDSFDKSPADIPLPNDLALQPSAIATQPPAQAELLKSFAAQGGWPADQDLDVTFDFVRIDIDPKTGASTRSAPDLDVASINPSNLIILGLSASGAAPVAYDAPVYVPNGDHGTLIVKRKADAKGLRHWGAATYIAAVKGGPGGILTKSGGTFNQRPAMYLLTQGLDLSLPQNQQLITCDPAVPCTREMKAAKAAQLEELRKAYLLPFSALEAAGFPTKQIANLTAFTITDRVRVVADPAAAALPFPSDFLLDPATGHLLASVQDPVHGPFGSLGPALGTLDGFSTTGLITASTSGLIDPATVNRNTVFIYQLGATLTRVPEAAELAAGAKPGFAAVSGVLAQSAGLSAINVVALQPAVPIPLPGGGAFAMPPLKEGTEYAVVLTDGITEPGGKHIAQATLGRLLALSSPLIANGAPTVAGLSLADAQHLEPLRLALSPVLDDLVTKGVTRDHVVMAWTMRTQSGIKSTATQLAALPYGTPTSTLSPLPGTAVSTGAAIATTMSAYGVDPTGVPNGNIGALVEAQVLTFNKLLCNPGDATCTDTGAFSPAAVNPVVEPINALIATPQPGTAAVGGCIPGTVATPVCTVPLVVFRHGLGGSRRDMLFAANELTKAGFAVAAIDATKHGDRSYCQVDAECATGSTCVADPTLANEGDAPNPTPGKCMVSGTPGDFARNGSCATCTNTKSTPIASGNFLVSFNLFRTRDSLRQDVIDQSQLIRVLSPNPACDVAAAPTDAAHTCANKVITSATGFQIDPHKIYYAGQSLGAIQGVMNAAANPRIAKAALNAGGGTIVDVFSDKNSALSLRLNQLLQTKGLDQATNPSGYLQFLTVAKWVLDPADPLNFAQNLKSNTLAFPDATLNAIAPAPATRPVLGQMALCDTTVVNSSSAELYQLIGLGAATQTSGTLTTFAAGSAPLACPTNGVKHGFLLDWADYGTSITPAAQDDIAAFFSSNTLPSNIEFAP